jgi:catechol 2,3-dioxygenase-like lactoylglutathione lyase family enzyme
VKNSGHLTGFTIQLRVPDIERGKAFYASLIGREPDFSPHLDFHECQLRSEAWLQLGEGTPLAAYPLRLGVSDIEQRRSEIERDLSVSCSPVAFIPGLVAYCSFLDPFGNKLGFYEDLSNGKLVGPGGYESTTARPQYAK